MDEHDDTSGDVPQTKLDTTKVFSLEDWSVHDEFEQLGVIGRGAFGHVLCVRQKGKLFALKLFEPREPSGSERARPRFIRGARIMKDRLRHPGIVAVHEIYGANTSKPAFLMDYVPGPDLRAFVRDDSAEAKALVLLVAEVADILDYAHHEDIVHRDVKPRNVLVLQKNDTLRPILTDFDLAYEPSDESLSFVADSELAQVQIGTAYMHPEFRQNFDRYADDDSVNILRHQALDYFSLCMTLYFVLTRWDPSNDAAMEKRLGELEVSLREAFGTRGLALLHEVITGAMRCATVAEVPQLTSDLKRQLEDALSRPSLTKNLATRMWGAPSAADFRRHYGAPKAAAIRRSKKVSMLTTGGSLIVGGLGWALGGAPIVFSAITIFGIASFLSSQRIVQTIDDNPPVLPAAAIWANRVYPIALWSGRALFLVFLASAGAFAVDLIKKPAVVDFREHMVMLRGKLSKPQQPNELPAPPESRLGAKATGIAAGDTVEVLEVNLDATVSIRIRGEEQRLNLDATSPFENNEAITADTRRLFDQAVASMEQAQAVVLRYDAASRAIALDQRGKNLSRRLVAAGWLRDAGGSDAQSERNAMEQGLGLWRHHDCELPCTFGSGCTANSEVCSSGWHCVPTQEQLAPRSWELYLLGAGAEDVFDLKVCASAYGKRGCVGAEAAAQTQTGIPFFEDAGLTLDNGAYGAHVWVKSTAPGDATEATIFADKLSFRVTPEAICHGFNIHKNAKDGRAVTLRFRLREAR